MSVLVRSLSVPSKPPRARFLRTGEDLERLSKEPLRIGWVVPLRLPVHSGSNALMHRPGHEFVSRASHKRVYARLRRAMARPGIQCHTGELRNLPPWIPALAPASPSLRPGHEVGVPGEPQARLRASS